MDCDLERTSVLSYLLRRGIRLSFSVPDIFLPLSYVQQLRDGEVMMQEDPRPSETAGYFLDHDGQDTGGYPTLEFQPQEDRLFTRQRLAPATLAIFVRPSRFGPRACTYGIDYNLREILAVDPVNKTWYTACVKEIAGKPFMLVSRLIRVSADWRLRCEVDDGDDSLTCLFSGHVSRFLALGTLKPPARFVV